MLYGKFKMVLFATFLFMTVFCNGQKDYKMGSYGYDANFMENNGIKYKELISVDGNSRIMIVPSLQGRVMTTSSYGMYGDSYGWINYRFIKNGKISKQFNPYGGEERLWLGPEGGPFSLYFKTADNQIYDKWVVPAAFDTEPFDIKYQNKSSICLVKDIHLINAKGTSFDIQIERKVSLMTSQKVLTDFGIKLSEGMRMVAYESDNTITNIGTNIWKKENGLVSIWMLSQFSPTPSTTVFIPYKKNLHRPIINDEYFGKVPSDRLMKDNKMVYFKIDGRYRSKIGMPPARSIGLCGSYDSSKGLLTILWCNLPKEELPYVNGQWGYQKNPYIGDVINSYNDGPVEDGTIMGPFYEIETSSPGAQLDSKASITHIQKIIHIQGTERQLAPIVKAMFGVELQVIKTKFE